MVFLFYFVGFWMLSEEIISCAVISACQMGLKLPKMA